MLWFGGQMVLKPLVTEVITGAVVSTIVTADEQLAAAPEPSVAL
jgi:hypothetical protein